MIFGETFKKLKNLFDAYKMWVFVVALFGTNGMQWQYMRSEPVEPVKVEKQKVKPKVKKEPSIDLETVKKLIKKEVKKHANGRKH